MVNPGIRVAPDEPKNSVAGLRWDHTMLWDVDLHQVLIGFILCLAGGIAAAMVWVVVRRAVRKRYYHRLDLERERYRSMVIAIIEGRFEGDLGSLRRRARTVEWVAIEILLLEVIEQSSGRQQGRVTEVFEQLSYVDFYIQELEIEIPWRRAMAAQRLGRMRSTRAIPALLRALEDKFRDVRQNAMQALGQMRDPQALDILVSKLGEAIYHNKNFSRRVLMTALISYGEIAVPLLIRKLSDPFDAVRGLAAEILGEIPNPQALPALIKSMEDPSPEVRARAAYALGRIGQPLAVRHLIAALSDPFWYVRLQAARSLGRLASPRAIYDLWLRLTDPHAQVRLAAAESLVLIGPPALQALTSQLLYTADRYAREQVSEVLQQSGLIDRWIEDLDATDETVVQQIQELLVAAARGRTLASMVNALQGHPRPQVRMRLLDILGRAGMPSALKTIHRVALHDPDPLIRERAREVMLRATAKNKVRAINGLGNHR